jgi:serine/threonine protein phosphatase PrpC
LAENPKFIAGDYGGALRETFLDIDILLRTEKGRKEIKDIFYKYISKNTSFKVNVNMLDRVKSGDPDIEGCTANVLLIKNGFIYIANAGDSRSVLASKRVATDLSLDHKPGNEIELTRIKNAGGVVTNGRVQNNLNLSRALGDLQYKKDLNLIAEDQIITANPDIKIIKIEKDFDFIIMGCDGIYESLTSQELVDKFYAKFDANSNNTLTSIVEDIVDPLVAKDKDAIRGCDNMTCILIKFK